MDEVHQMKNTYAYLEWLLLRILEAIEYLENDLDT